MGDDEEVEAAGLYTDLCSTSTAQSLGSVQLLLKKKSTAVERCSTLSCAVEERFVHLPSDDHWFHPVQVCSVPGPQSQWIVSVNAW